MTTTTAKVEDWVALTGEEAKLLRSSAKGNGTYVGFHAVVDKDRQGYSYIRITEDIRHHDYSYAGSRIVAEIPVGYRMTTYEDAIEDRAYCFHGISTPAYHPEWVTAIRNVREGDELQIHWIRGNNHEKLREIEWARDELQLLIRRGKTVSTYLLDVYVGPDNTARMTRREA